MRRATLLLATFFASAAHAALPASVRVESAGCPDAASVVRELGALLPGVVVGEQAGAVTVVVRDEGPGYRVIVGDSERTLADPQRRCADRAHAAAVVADLILAPPTVEAPPPRPAVFVDLAAAGLLELAPAGSLLVGGGGELRLEVGARFVSGVVGARALAPALLTLGRFHAEIARFPVDVGVRLALRRRRVELSAQAGLALAALRIVGRDLSLAQAETRLDPEARLALGLRVWLSGRLGLEAGFTVDVSLRTVDLQVDPVGVVGQTPRVYLGFGLGPVFRVLRPER
jgi:hypothetical protein